MPRVQVLPVVEYHFGFWVGGNKLGGEDRCCCICNSDRMPEKGVKVRRGKCGIAVERAEPSGVDLVHM